MADLKVFTSCISRGHKSSNNDLYDLLHLVPAQPSCVVKKENIEVCDFQPDCDKQYVSKKRSRHKVKTVRQIRDIFERDIYNYLPGDLEKQDNALLKKISGGSAKDKNTKLFAKNILKSDEPVSRSTWQMLMNVNPEGHPHATQYVSWNGTRIQVVGSKGGKNKFVCGYDLGGKMSKLVTKSKITPRKRLLLQDSLAIKFKPGPLSKKYALDVSHQKYNIGNSGLVNLPKPGLEIQPTCGIALEPSTANFLHNLRDLDGTISEKWAEFAVCMVSSSKSRSSLNSNSITFDLNYKYNQQRILMRYSNYEHDLGSVEKRSDSCTLENVKKEVEKVLDRIIDAVEINIKQDNLFSGEDEPRQCVSIPEDVKPTFTTKEKSKRKYGELERLDVTVIRIKESSYNNITTECHNSYCALGCVCSSLHGLYSVKRHCGRVECMFECKCGFLMYKNQDSNKNAVMSELLPDLNLTKEEQKFHQTVIMDGDKSMLLKTKKRHWKASKKYAEFYSGMCLKTEMKKTPIMSIVTLKLNLSEVEPWCMVHNLYKCFCKGKFTGSGTNDHIQEELSKNDHAKVSIDENITTNDDQHEKHINGDSKSKSLRVRTYGDRKESSDSSGCECARSKPYEKRNYSDEFYHSTNKRIKEMEQDDESLLKRITQLSCGEKYGSQSIDVQSETVTKKVTQEGYTTNEEDVRRKRRSISSRNNDNFCEHDITFVNATDSSIDESELFNENLSTGEMVESKSSTALTKPMTLVNPYTRRLPVKSKLVAWIETNYQHYKQCLEQGVLKLSLGPPTHGKMALYPWEFVLGRYRDRKNVFLVSKKAPYRIYMAVDINHPNFGNCINIDDIRFADLHKYPITIKNLLTNTTNLHDNFCILYGLRHCWEVIGSVRKVQEVSKIPKEKVMTTTAEEVSTNEDLLSTNEDSEKETNTDSGIGLSIESSKWFVMNIENDFSEIQFYNRGFFVKYDSIVNAINVARNMMKTVRLSSKKVEGATEPQFGLYAIPNVNQYCVYIGPYEKDEPLGIETIKSAENVVGQRRTRGVWMTTNKVDNAKVIDNPLSFLPRMNVSEDEMVGIHCSTTDQETSNTSKVDENNTNKKMVKPIKIRKTNGFYHLAPTGIIYKKSLLLENKTTSSTGIKKKIFNKPVAEIAPQLKTKDDEPMNTNSSVPSTSRGSHPQQSGNSDKKGMLILKPEEINQRFINSDPMENEDINMDIENFLAVSQCIRPGSDSVLIISDDETEKLPIDVWIQCKNVDMGLICAKRDAEARISFVFPGFKFTDYYSENEAFSKINQVLSRKVYLPKSMKLEWEVIECIKDARTKAVMTAEKLNPNYVVTKKGLRPKSELAQRLQKNNSIGLPTDKALNTATNDDTGLPEDHTTSLEEVRRNIFNRTASKEEIMTTLNNASRELRRGMSKFLENMLDANEELNED